jgi:AcrR family transcriptional regulator
VERTARDLRSGLVQVLAVDATMKAVSSERGDQMTSPRRVGAETSKTRTHLLETAERIMVDDGYAAVTYRALAAKAGVTAGLVQYYFPTLDDLFIAMLRQRTDRTFSRLVEALRLHADEPLRAVWELNRDDTTAALMTEFLALANHRKNIRAEVALVTSRFRKAQLEALKAKWPEYGLLNEELSPALCIFLLQAIPKMILLENAIGEVTVAHAQVLKLVNQYIDRIEPRRKTQKSGKVGAKPRSRRSS